MCREMGRALWSFSAERIWSTRCADWIGLSSAPIRARLLSSVSLRSEALPTIAGRVPAPGPEAATLLHTEHLLLRATRLLHVIPCPAIVLPPGDTPVPLSTAHRHVIIDRKARLSSRILRKCFTVLLFDFCFHFLKPNSPLTSQLSCLEIYIPQSGTPQIN